MNRAPSVTPDAGSEARVGTVYPHGQALLDDRGAPMLWGVNSFASITSQTDVTALQSVSGVFAFIWYVILVIALWKVFTKAGYPGWLAIIPLVNSIIIVKIAGFSAWMWLLYIVPIVNIVFSIIVALRVGRGFGKGAVFSVFLLWLIHAIGFLILGYGSSQYDKSRVTA